MKPRGPPSNKGTNHLSSHGDLPEFHDIQHVVHYPFDLVMPTLMEMGVIPIPQRMATLNQIAPQQLQGLTLLLHVGQQLLVIHREIK